MGSVGKRILRTDGEEKTLGKTQFIADYQPRGCLWAKVLLSEEPHAEILNIDTSAAKKVEGVHAVLTSKDIPGTNINPLIKQDQPFLAEGKIMHPGQALAVVAAETREAAIEAVRLIKVDTKPLKASLTIEESLSSDAPRLHEDDNKPASYRIRKGDVSAGFKKAEVIVEGEYSTGYQEHAYLETQGMVAEPEEGGRMLVRGSMQCPFYVLPAVSQILGLPLSRVRVVQAVTGGAFGGKEDVPSLVAGWTALAAYKTGRPVKLILNREEDFKSMSKRHPSKVKLKLGAGKDGVLTSCKAEIYLDAGGYATLSPVVLWRSTVHALGPYKCPNVHVDSCAVATNKSPAGAFRGFGSPQVIFATESLLDELAEKLNMDPAELRMKNALEPGSETSTGHILDSAVHLKETLQTAMNNSDWEAKRKKYPEKVGTSKRGIGISSIMYGVGLGAGGKHLDRSGAFVQILQDGSAQVAVGTTEMGQGMKTVLIQIAADALGLPPEKVSLLPIDTSRVPDSGPTVASRATVMSGNAIIDAASKIRKNLLNSAAGMLNCTPEDLDVQDGWILMDNEKKYSVVDALKQLFLERRHPAAQGWFKAPETSFNESGIGDAYFTYSFMTDIAEVEVDLLTGQVDPVRITCAVDIGKAVNPMGVEGQIEGGLLQGVGYALTEEILTGPTACINNPDFTTYIIPTAMDHPEVHSTVVESYWDAGPYGAKGLGELPLMGIAPALTNAIYNAVGVRIRELPAKPERIFAELKKKTPSPGNSE